MGGVLLGAIVGAIVSAVVTVYLQKRLTRDPAIEVAALRERIEALERQRREREELLRFSPSGEIVGATPGGQWLKLSADRSFTLRRLDYIADDDSQAFSEEINKSGNELQVPIDPEKIRGIFTMQNRRDHRVPIPVKFRCHLEIDGLTKTHIIEARLHTSLACGGINHWVNTSLL